MSQQHHILIIDDEPDIRELLVITLNRMGLKASCAEDLASAKRSLQRETFDLCLTDLKLPDGSGINLVEHIQSNYPELPVAVITAYGSMDIAIAALKAGAFDFINKPVELDRLRSLIDSALSLNEQQQDQGSTQKLLGESPNIENLRSKIIKLSRSQAPVFIHGESGSGKELVARLIHENSPRKSQPFIAVNCGAIPSELVESEFFGHKKGAFTGASEHKQGLFQAADGGTLFLDEVADLTLDMQVKLLRAIQEKSVRAVGATQEQKVDIRILSATHKSLVAEIEAERFRSDLYYRINVIELNVPPLRERSSDIPLLANKILKGLCSDGDSVRLSANALAQLQNYSFPGNVRELQNILERAYTMADSGLIEADDLLLRPDALSHVLPAQTDQPKLEQNTSPRITLDSDLNNPTAQPDTALSQPKAEVIGFDPRLAYGQLEEFLADIEKQILLSAIDDSNGNKTAAAKLLGISFRTLRYRLKKFEMD